MRARALTGTSKAIAAALVVLVGTAAGCGGSGGSDASQDPTGTEAITSATTGEGEATDTTTDEDPSTSAAPLTTVSPGLPDASEAQHTAPADGTGTALLTTVRIGRNEGFERIVFEFKGTSRPGYRIQWVDPPILSDGSGEEVAVTGEAYLEMIMEPASGVDLSAPQLTIVYEGPDRIATTQTELITDLVRTGDFEAVLTWVAGTTERVPVRVLTLTDPVRIVVDLEAS